MQRFKENLRNGLIRVKTWLLTPVPRWRTIVATVSFMAIMIVTLLYGGSKIFAATYTFNQTDWSGGQSASTLAHPTNQTGWDKYSEQSNTDTTGTVGSLKTTAGAPQQYAENFSSTTYKDAGNTTAVWAGGFGQYRTITIDYTKVPSTLSNFPVLVSGTYSYLATTANGGKVTNASGYDIGFYSSSSCASGKLSWETESYNATTGAVNYWVKVTSVSSSADTVIYLCYGNTSITTDQSAPTAVWDASYRAVYHLGDGTTLTATDSTANAEHGTITSATATTGKIRGSANFSGSSQYIFTSDLGSISTNLTVEAWVKPNSAGGVVIGEQNNTAMPGNSYHASTIEVKTDNTVRARTWNLACATAGSGITYGNWYHTVMRYASSGTLMTSFVNGAAGGTATATRSGPGAVTYFYIGGSDTTNCGIGTAFSGAIDEVRISSFARANGWITAEYNNMNIPDKATDSNGFYTVGSEITPTSVSIHGVYYRSITIDSTRVPSTQTDFPVLVSGTYTYLKTTTNGGNVLNASGYDVGFYTNSDCSTGKMTWETERYTASSGAVSYWVKVPSLSSSADTTFYMCYGNPAITTDQSATTSVWDTNYKGVWHFNSVDTDSTSNALNFGTPVGSTSYTTGKIANTRYFVSTNAELSTSSTSILDNNAHTIDFWFYMYPSAAGYYQVLDYRAGGSDRSPGIWTHPSLNCLHWRYDAGNTGVNCGGPTGDNTYFTNYTFYHVVGVKNGSSFTIYVNGSPRSTATVVNPKTAGSAVLELGAGVSSSANYFIDELKISNIARSPDWIATEYNSQNIPDKATDATNGFYTIGSEVNTSVVAQSIKVNTGTNSVGSLTLTKTDSGSVTYYASNDGGTNFFQVTPGSLYTFASGGTGDVRWKVSMTGAATVSSINIDMSGYATTATLTSNAYDTGDANSFIAKVAWTPSGETATELVKIQIRTSPDGSTWSGWCGYSDTSTCAGTNYFLTANLTGGIATVPDANLIHTGNNDRWFQYLVTLVSGGAATASLDNLTITYVVNVVPDFNPSAPMTVSQITDSADANFGKVKIDYSVRDTDTASGTTNPGFVTPSFEYNIGGGWLPLTANLSAEATTNKAVDPTAYTAYTVYWDAATGIPTNYLTTAQVRLTINDNEGGNNIVTSTSSNFTLDTKVPAVSASTFDSTTDIITLTAADDTNLQYRISNNADLSADGVNATSGQWQTVGATSVNITPAWTPTGSPSYENIYIQVRDTAGNLSSPNIVTPSSLLNINLQDISNVPIEVYKEFMSWAVYTPPASGAAFANYKVYRSTDGSSYSLVSTITDVATNFYFDASISANTTYYYKIKITDTNGDVGNYSTAVSDKADGQGGTDLIAPSITSITVSETQATYVTITWTTDELSNSRVEYSLSPSTSFNLNTSVASYVTAHSVTLTGLTPSTAYLFQVKSTDAVANIGTDSNSGTGYSFTTVSGPIISNVTETSVGEHSATIFWNTDRDSDSYVSYSINANLSSPSRTGSATLVGSSFQHSVNLTGLNPGTKYYYFVESTDVLGNHVQDTNGNNYYSFTTTNDDKAPVISNVSVPVTSLTAVVVVWDTDENSSSIVDYGTTSGTYSTSTALDSTPTDFHVVSLSNLLERTTYYLRVRSADGAGNETTSSESSFVTDTAHVVNAGGGGGGSGPQPDVDPPVISNIKVRDIKPFSATVSFDTDEETIGFVDYGIDPLDLDMTDGEAYYSLHNQIKITNLKMGKMFTFLVKASDRAGNMTVSEKETFTTTFLTESAFQIKDIESFQKEIEEAIESALPSLVPPFVSKPVVSDITDSSAKVSWKTNVKSYGTVAYTEDASYNQGAEDPYGNESADTVNKFTDHEIVLSNLKPDTLYHIMARSFSLPEVVGRSSDVTFLTEAPKIQANIGSITNDSFKATWATSEPTTSVVEYRNLKTGELNQKSSDTKTRAHDILVDGLTPGTSYNVNVFGYNEKGNKVSIASSVRITTSIDTIPPVITSLTIDSALIAGRTDRTQTIVSWKTNEPSTSIVLYKEGSALPDEKLTNKVEQTNNLVIDHAVVVSTLKPGGLYSIQVASTDQAGNTALFPIRTAVVPQQGQSVVEIIFKNFEETFEFLR